MLAKIAQYSIIVSFYLSGIYLQVGGLNAHFSYILMLSGVCILTAIKGILRLDKQLFFWGMVFILINIINLISWGLLNSSFNLSHILNSSFKLIFFFIICYSSLAIYYDRGESVADVFRKYIQVSYVFSFVGVVQQVVFLTTNFNMAAALGLRYKELGFFIGVPSLSVEPAFFAITLLPAVCYKITEAFTLRKLTPGLMLTITGLIFSGSSLGLVGVIICIIINTLLISKKNVIKGLVGLMLLIVTLSLVGQHDSFKSRFSSSLTVLLIKNSVDPLLTNLSVYSIYANARIATSHAKDSLGMGAGFGMYSKVYDTYINAQQKLPGDHAIPGRGSATSFLIRLVAEMGVIFAILLIYKLFKSTSFKVSANQNAIINVATTCVIMIIFIRAGEYYLNGVAFVLVTHFKSFVLENDLVNLDA